MLRAAVLQVIAVDARDYHVLQLQGRDGRGQMLRLRGIRRQRASVRHVAERAAARADVAQDHERCRTLAEAFADVGTGGFLAHRM
jgi:hypothetical protein